MSATNRGGQRRPSDFYETPEWVTRAFLHRFTGGPIPKPGLFDRVLEPAAGNGAIIRVLRHYGHVKHLTAVELVAHRALHLRTYVKPTRLVKGDFRAFARFTMNNLPWAEDGLEADPSSLYSFVITNPPFSHALDFAYRGLELTRPGGYMAMLLRLAFLEGKERLPFHRGHPSDVYILPKRPSFTGDGNSDMAAYAWFVWGPGCGNRWEHLDMPEAIPLLPPRFFDLTARALVAA